MSSRGHSSLGLSVRYIAPGMVEVARVVYITTGGQVKDFADASADERAAFCQAVRDWLMVVDP